MVADLLMLVGQDFILLAAGFQPASRNVLSLWRLTWE